MWRVRGAQCCQFFQIAIKGRKNQNVPVGDKDWMNEKNKKFFLFHKRQVQEFFKHFILWVVNFNLEQKRFSLDRSHTANTSAKILNISAAEALFFSKSCADTSNISI